MLGRDGEAVAAGPNRNGGVVTGGAAAAGAREGRGREPTGGPVWPARWALAGLRELWALERLGDSQLWTVSLVEARGVSCCLGWA